MSSSTEVRDLGFGVAFVDVQRNILFTAYTSGPATSAPSMEEGRSTGEYVLRGTNDALPNEWHAAARDSTVITPGIRFKSLMDFSGGVTYGRRKVIDGKEDFEYLDDKRINDFLLENKIHEEALTALMDLNFFGDCNYQLVPSKDKTVIARLTTRFTRSKWCRVSRMDTDGEIKTLFVNPDFGTQGSTEKQPKKIPLVPFYNEYAWAKKQMETGKPMAYRVRLPDLGNQHYSDPDWTTAYNSKWLEIAKNIAEFKKYLLTNQFVIKYHIEFHADYWPAKFGKEAWAALSDVEKKSKAAEELKSWSDYLSGAPNAAKALMTGIGHVPGAPDKVYSLVKVNELKNEFGKEGTYIEDSKEASDHMISAMGLHPDILGNAPGSTLGSGSGSGNRNAYNQRISMAHFIQQQVLQPLQLVAKLNGWPEGVVFTFRQSLITTLDTGAEATKAKAPLEKSA